MNRAIIGGTLAVALCVSSAWWWLYPRSSTKTALSKSPDAAAIGELRRDVRALKEARVADLLVAARQANAAPVAAPSPSNVPRDPALEFGEPAPSDAEREQEAAKAEAAVLANLEAAFADERPDGRWSGSAANDIARSLPATLPKGSNVSAVNCKSRMCRLETTHENVQTFAEFNNAAFARAGQSIWRGGVYSAVREQSARGIVAVTFLAREGGELPVAPPSE